MGDIRVRPLEASDRTVWDKLWHGYLTFYKVSDFAPDVTEATWQRLLDPNGPLHGLVAVDGDKILGLVHFLYHPSSWTIGPYCYLQDLFTFPAARKRGVGEALIEAVADAARAENAARVYWLTHETNAPGRSLYDRVARHAGFIHYIKDL
ncbi:MAG: GNAT family N-acetyltransferase [Aquidulcibacter sp.]|jgi:GNAT superfamily N-acetyltransferase|uniref:GNAT family N-acetyltransferase n=1 Tax=Aquidulcibacter sp. TaxID=2052990 RepID=UPI0022BFCB51|nr:GNAT family N-acetyltransferase [Aquidulcibacter sp.]MCE2889935.1 GNAT family N-acetyltransferase [Hyphomonadaceae bacterium]MCZ8209560.1 GNAT family N-acetyltransferase [Aquidulcibacter sp.]